MMAEVSNIDEVQAFLDSPTFEDDIENLTKDSLLIISTYLDLGLTIHTKKSEMIRQIVKHAKSEDPMDQEKKLESLKLEIRIRELALEEIKINKEFEAVRFDKESSEREKERQHEIRMAELKVGENAPLHDQFDVTKFFRVVPKFNEQDVPKFFMSFEKIAVQLAWPKEQWPILLQCSLVGKAQVAYSCLSVEDSSNYDAIKKAILKAYELVPEAYKQKFRELKKAETQTYVDFAREKEQLFSEWCRSKDVEDYRSLRELVLIEEFKSCIPKEIKTHIDEMQTDVLDKAAVIADEYALNHKAIFKSRDFFSDKNRSGGYFMDRDKDFNTNGSRSRTSCFYCGKPGHVKAQCYKFKWDQVDAKKPVCLVNIVNSKSDDSVGLSKINEDLRDFAEYLSLGTVKAKQDSLQSKQLVLLRDTGARQSLVLEKSLPQDFQKTCKEFALIGGFPNTVVSCPLEVLYLESPLVTGHVKVAVVKTLPLEGVDFILANDLVRGERNINPVMVSSPVSSYEDCDMNCIEDVFPVGVITRSKSKKLDTTYDEQILEDLPNIFEIREGEVHHLGFQNNLDPKEDFPGSREKLIEAQNMDNELQNLKAKIGFPGHDHSYFVKDKVLMRKYHPVTSSPEENWKTVEQIVVPSRFRDIILLRAHEDHFSGHFGIRKTMNRVLKCFYWPSVKKDVSRHCKTCHSCQIIGKPNRPIEKAPLLPIPSIGEPFKELVIDIVGPLPRTRSGHEYLLTIIDRASRYPEAIPLRGIKSPVIVKHLIDFFSRFGLPATIQSDQGANFTSKYFKSRMSQLGIKQLISTAYHPESQGVVERMHQTLKTMMKKYCLEKDKSWDTEVPYLLFAIRSSPNDSLGFSQFDLVFGHSVRGPIEVIRDCWEDDSRNLNLLDWVVEFRTKLCDAWNFANQNLVKSQGVMKLNFDKKANKALF